jgi:diguanylate cyclase
MSDAQCAEVAEGPESQRRVDTVEKAAEHLRMVLPLLNRYKLPADPLNYALLYAYVAGHSQALTQELEPVIGGETVLTHELARRLFSRYVCESDTSILEPVRQELGRVVSETAGEMRQAGGETTRLRKTLESHAETLSRHVDAAEIPRIVTDIIGTTLSLSKTGEHLESHLASVSGQVDDLRQELERLRRESVTDTLTSLMNRRAFDRAIAEAIAGTLSQRVPLCLLMVDVDHFKKVNDTFGHLVGDKVLRLIAELLRKGVKGRDTAARYGGEEFALILPETPLEGARAVAESIRKAIERSRLKRTDTGEPIGVVTVSIGAARYREGESPEHFVNRCDMALYQAKRSGRNRVALAP